MNIVIDDTDHPLIIKVATLLPTRMQVYFIDNDDYFERHGSEGLETQTHFEENDERTMFFVRGTVETVKKLRWEPSIVHCTGWIAALAPLYLKRIYRDDPSFRGSKIVYSLFNDSFEGNFDPRMVEKLILDGFEEADLKALLDGPVDYKKLNKIAIDYADAIVQSVADADPELVEYARNSGKPFMEYPGDDLNVDAYLDFYSTL
jgi:starch synthase